MTKTILKKQTNSNSRKKYFKINYSLNVNQQCKPK